MVSALLAMEVFNARDTSIVPELDQKVFQECDIQIDMDRSLVFNTDTYGHLAAESLLQQDGYPCAGVGPSNDMPAQELSVLAAATHFPLTVNRAFNVRIVSDTFSPYTSQVFPDLISSTDVLVRFLIHKGRTDFVAALFPLTDTGTQRMEGFDLASSDIGMRHEVVSYITPALDGGIISPTANIPAALERVKRTGFRTIALAMEVVFLELPPIADAAEEQGLLNGDYFWVLAGSVEPALLFSTNENVTKLLKGAAWLTPSALHSAEPDKNRFLKAWLRSNSTQVDRANAANPMKAGEAGYFLADSSYFQTYLPDYGNGFMFDSVMATAMGACLAADRNDGNDSGDTVTSMAHLRGIRSVDFEGATGRVKFARFADSDGARLASTITWAVFNLIPSLVPFVPVAMSEIYLNGTWTKATDFVYADGTTEPPKLLRDEPEQNYLNSVIRGVGLALMGIVLLMATTTTLWVYIHRKHRVLRAAQPQFLYVVALGAAISVSTIIPISFDESYGWSEQQLSRACMAIPWLLSLGHIITYGALFSKLWRINKVLQFSRRKVDVKQVAWPTAVLAVLALLVLSIWTGLDSFKWERDEINALTGESIGECRSDHMTAFLSALVVLMVIPTILVGGMAWKTKDVDDAYSESQWIFTMIVVQMEVILVAVPTITILRDVSTDGRYLGFMFLVLAFPMSALAFVMAPKVFSYYEAIRSKKRNAKQASKRGDAKGSVWISGLPASPYPIDSNMGVAAPFGRDTLNTVSRTPEASSVVFESNSGIDDPPMEPPPAMQEPPPSSTSLGSHRSGRDVLNTVPRTPQASSDGLESNSGIEDPSTESPLAMQEPPPSSSTGLGSNRSAVIFRDTNTDKAIDCQSPPEPEQHPSSNKLSSSESLPLASSARGEVSDQMIVETTTKLMRARKKLHDYKLSKAAVQ
jgi:hypothetical protein